MTDKELLRRLRRGDESAVEAAIDRYGAYTAAVVHRALGSFSRPEDVEELCSDVFFTLWQKRDSLSGDGIRPWLAAVARNRAKSFLRTLGAVADETSTVVETGTASAEALVEERETRAELADAIARLSEGDRELFLRHYYGGETVPKIAEETGLHPENVKSRLRRGREKLKKILEKGGRDR
ncbi:MAG: sigma-70 family RNA polymerase sigma factor [Oscillospiraceae bacterium]|nr:sigma-70 family RNA polymerase sigma factor [Oscillospiraceae bacterium]